MFCSVCHEKIKGDRYLVIDEKIYCQALCRRTDVWYPRQEPGDVISQRVTCQTRQGDQAKIIALEIKADREEGYGLVAKLWNGAEWEVHRYTPDGFWLDSRRKNPLDLII